MAMTCEANQLNIEELKEKFKDIIKIPRPKFNDSTSARQKSFRTDCSDWFQQSVCDLCYNMSMLKEKEKFLLTPFEEEHRVWRQLWEIVENSDVVVQILDARNPLLFQCEDLEKYVKEVKSSKVNALLLNKADLLTKRQRKIWAKHFDSLNIQVAFFSAVLAFEKRVPAESDPESEQEEDDKDEIIIGKSGSKYTTVEEEEVFYHHFEDTEFKNSSKLLGRNELISFFKSLPENTLYCNYPGHVRVGLVGHPNVGTKSTIYALIQQDISLESSIQQGISLKYYINTSVHKYFSMLRVDDKLSICGCHDFVMPRIVSSEAEMIISGILPIYKMKDHVPPINLLLSLIPQHVLEAQYAIMIPKPKEGDDPDQIPSAKAFLNAYGYSRGFMMQNGQPNDPRSARCILKDFLYGRLLYCHAPPGVPQQTFHTFTEKEQSCILKSESKPQRAVSVAT